MLKKLLLTSIVLAPYLYLIRVAHEKHYDEYSEDTRVSIISTKDANPQTTEVNMHSSQLVEIISSMLGDLGKEFPWQTLVLRKILQGMNGTAKTTKARICVLSVDSRPLEKFSSIKEFENMSFHSIAAYNSLFYGKVVYLKVNR